METIKKRLPSRSDALSVFMVCAIPIFIWSLIYTFVEIPAWIIRTNTWDLIGMIAYTQAFALIESLSIGGIFILIGIILPPKLFKDRIVAISAIIMLTTSIWFIIAHFNDELISEWTGKQLLVWVSFFSVSIITMYVLVLKIDKLDQFINSFCDRLSVLSSLYIFIGVFSLFIIFIRNIF